MPQLLTMFDTLGFECIIDYEDLCGQAMMAKLAGTTPPRNPIGSMMLRAKANPQRFPEIWVFNSDIGADELYEIATDEPQMIADLIRERGENIFKTPKEKQVIS